LAHACLVDYLSETWGKDFPKGAREAWKKLLTTAETVIESEQKKIK
jgi:hypothetical protein